MKKLFTSVLLIFFISSSNAEEIKLGVENFNLLPFSNVDKDDQYYGAAEEVLSLFFKKRGDLIRYIPLPIDRLFTELIKKRIDFKYPDNPRWHKHIKKDANISYSDIIFKSFDLTVTLRKNKKFNVNSIKSLGLIRGFFPVPYMERVGKKEVKIVSARDTDSLMSLLLKERVDAIYVNYHALKSYMKKLNIDDQVYEIRKDIPIINSNYSLSTTKHPEVIKEFNTFLKTDKEVLEILKKYKNFGDPTK